MDAHRHPFAASHLLILAAIGALAGCATPAPRPMLFIGPTPVCSAQAQCDQEWSAARMFVIHTSPNRIERDTPDYIFTYNTADSALAAEITREPAGQGTYRIVAVFGCNGSSDAKDCVPMDPHTALVLFNREVSAAGAAAP